MKMYKQNVALYDKPFFLIVQILACKNKVFLLFNKNIPTIDLKMLKDENIFISSSRQIDVISTGKYVSHLYVYLQIVSHVFLSLGSFSPCE
jgi:hypothetical protein